MHLRLNLQTFLPACAVTKKLLNQPQGDIQRDDLIILSTAKTRGQYPVELRRVEMFVELDGQRVLMAFITNNTHWAASTVGALNKSRWGIEVFFKQVKSTHSISDFLGHNKNAIRWQLWSALLLSVLLRHQARQAGGRTASRGSSPCSAE